MNLEPFQRPEVIRKVLNRKTVAIVGLSSNDLRASNFVGRYLLRNGYTIFPVNPREEEILGQKSYASLGDIPVPIDTVDVFRHPSAVPDIAREAVAIGATCLWLQYGVISEEGIDIAASDGLDVVADCCMKVEHARYLGRMHWLGFNTGRITAKRASMA
ncbi:MAG: putative CoA-binding protein [Lysobacterales bacterium]|jgi:predicted CoA-binding protein